VATVKFASFDKPRIGPIRVHPRDSAHKTAHSLPIKAGVSNAATSQFSMAAYKLVADLQFALHVKAVDLPMVCAFTAHQVTKAQVKQVVKARAAFEHRLRKEAPFGQYIKLSPASFLRLFYIRVCLWRFVCFAQLSQRPREIKLVFGCKARKLGRSAHNLPHRLFQSRHKMLRHFGVMHTRWGDLAARFSARQPVG